MPVRADPSLKKDLDDRLSSSSPRSSQNSSSPSSPTLTQGISSDQLSETSFDGTLTQSLERGALKTPVEKKINRLDLSTPHIVIRSASATLQKLKDIYQNKSMLEDKLLMPQDNIEDMQKEIDNYIEKLRVLAKDPKLINANAILHNTNEIILEASYAVRDALKQQYVALNERFTHLKKQLHANIVGLENPFEDDVDIMQNFTNEPLNRCRQQLKEIEQLHLELSTNFNTWEAYFNNKMPDMNKVVQYNDTQWMDNLQSLCMNEDTMIHRIDAIFEKVIAAETDLNDMLRYQHVLEYTDCYEETLNFLNQLHNEMNDWSSKNPRSSRVELYKIYQHAILENILKFENRLYEIISALDPEETDEISQSSDESKDAQIELLRGDLRQAIKDNLNSLLQSLGKKADVVKTAITKHYPASFCHDLKLNQGESTKAYKKELLKLRATVPNDDKVENIPLKR